MAASQQGMRKFKEWIALLKEQGWSLDDQKFLMDFWWKHHDDDGVIFPPGVVRPSAGEGE